ncbi:hypothetical protein V6N11_055783 [Hibiscus sabdariffa]|uniref:Uncharacterized protein n=1 Tax=Hibiscus sabdariffa TaxID=183260 RepID=A0ABR2ABV4_9ROSI
MHAAWKMIVDYINAVLVFLHLKTRIEANQPGDVRESATIQAEQYNPSAHVIYALGIIIVVIACWIALDALWHDLRPSYLCVSRLNLQGD